MWHMSDLCRVTPVRMLLAYTPDSAVVHVAELLCAMSCSSTRAYDKLGAPAACQHNKDAQMIDATIELPCYSSSSCCNAIRSLSKVMPSSIPYARPYLTPQSSAGCCCCCCQSSAPTDSLSVAVCCSAGAPDNASACPASCLRVGADKVVWAAVMWLMP